MPSISLLRIVLFSIMIYKEPCKWHLRGCYFKCFVIKVFKAERSAPVVSGQDLYTGVAAQELNKWPCLMAGTINTLPSMIFKSTIICFNLKIIPGETYKLFQLITVIITLR